MSPGAISTAHFSPSGQHVCFPFDEQHERLFGQHPAVPQHCDELGQHFFPHSSWPGGHRLQSPVDAFAHRKPFGQHLPGPQRACPSGQRGSQTCWEPAPTRTTRHSSFFLQHVVPQPVS